MGSRTMRESVLIVFNIGAVFGFIHLYGLSATAYAVNRVSSSSSLKSLSLLREREPDQAFLIGELENPTGLLVTIDFDEAYTVKLDNFTAPGLITGSDEAIIEPNDSIEFQLIVTLTEGWRAADTNLTVTIAGELEVSSSSLWVQNSQTTELNFTNHYDLFE